MRRLSGLQKSGDRADTARKPTPGDAQAQQRLVELELAYGDFQAAMASIVGNLQPLVNAKTAARRVVDDSEALLVTTQRMVEAYERELASRAGNFVVLALMLLLSAGVVWAMVRVYVNDERRRGEVMAENTDRRHTGTLLIGGTDLTQEQINAVISGGR